MSSAIPKNRVMEVMFEHPPYFMELEMTRLVTEGDIDAALLVMNRINVFKRAVLARDTVRSLKNSLICNCTLLARAAIAGGVSSEDAFDLSDKLIRTIENAGNIRELEALERKHLAEFVSLVQTGNYARYSKPIRAVMSYINRNLSEYLPLKTLAGIAGLSRTYLSRVFKEETGTGLADYILRRRVEEAKIYLAYTNNPISEISDYYQFSSQSHFTFHFRKLTGTTPLVYRKKS